MTTRRLFVALFLVALLAMAVRETTDPDLWWHLRTGQVILAEGVPRHDIFSFTVPDHDWITHEWLSQVLLWLVYQATGLPGLMVTFAALVALTFWLVYRSCAGRPYLAAFVVLLAAVTSAIVWGVRPQMFNLLLTAAFVWILTQYEVQRAQTRLIWLLPPLTALWANLHSGYLLGVVLLATVTVGEAGQQWLAPRMSSDDRALPWRGVRQLAGITVLSFLAAALNPNGPALWFYPLFTLGSSAMQTYIQEWHSPDFHLAPFWPFAAMMALGVLSWLYSRQSPTWSERLLFLGTAAAGLLSARNIPLFAIVTAPIISQHLLSSLEGTRLHAFFSGAHADVRPPAFIALLNGALLVLAVAAAGLWTATKITGNEAAIASRYPVAAVDYLVASDLAAARGYNSYNWGGYLIWRGIPVFVDGRADVYGDDFLYYYLKTYEVSPEWERPLNEFNVRYVLMERASPLTVLLAAREGWRERYADDVAQVFVRE